MRGEREVVGTMTASFDTNDRLKKLRLHEKTLFTDADRFIHKSQLHASSLRSNDQSVIDH